MNGKDKRLTLIRDIVKTKCSMEVDGMTVSFELANRLYQFYLTLTPFNRERFLSRGINEMKEISESVVMALNLKGGKK